MRLKLYEEYSPELYQKIDYSEYDKIHRDVTSISDSDVKIISDKFKIPKSPEKIQYAPTTNIEYDLVEFNIFGKMSSNTTQVSSATSMWIVRKYGKFAVVRYLIKKTNDEWFLITESCEELTIYQQYKCDQLEGVISFLSKKLYDLPHPNKPWLENFINEEYSDEPYYKEITFDEYTTDVDDKKVSLLSDRPSIVLFNKIKEDFNEKLKNDYTNKLTYWSKRELSIIYNRRSVEITLDLYKRDKISLKNSETININKSASILLITKAIDEWYYVIDYGTSKFYKCDQLDGLTKCLYDSIDKLLEKIDDGNEKTINLLRFN